MSVENLTMSLLQERFASQRGVALVIVLWIFIFLFVVAFDFTAAVREEATAAHRFSDDAQGYYLAIAGFEQGLFDFLHQPSRKELAPNQTQMDLFDGSWREGKLGTGIYRMRLLDEGGRININRADENTLRRVFTHLGIAEPRRAQLIDSIMDWRDPDDLHRVNGAENDYYLSLPRPYTARNGPFDTIEELLWVRGVSPELYFGSGDEGSTANTGEQKVGLRDIFTVDSPVDRVNLRTAPAEVINALTGIPLEKCRGFVEERKKLSDKTIADLLPLLGIGAGDAAMQLFVFTNPSVFTVEAEGRHPDSRVPRRVKGVVRASGGTRGFELVRWVDRDIAVPER